MFLRQVRVESIAATGERRACLLAHIDSFCMRNFTNDATFDDTLPIADGQLEVGNLVPLSALQKSMEAWFRRKGYLNHDETLVLTEVAREHESPYS